MARRRLGLAAIRRLQQCGSLAEARARLAGTAYADAADAEDLATAQRAVAAALLWQVRVLAGWMPSSGTQIARTVAAAFERENLAAHLRHLGGAPPVESAPFFELGSLSTAWHRARHTVEVATFQAELAASPWGEVPVDDEAAFRDATAAAWLGRLAREVPEAEPVAVAGAVLLLARCRLVERRTVPAGVAVELDRLLGDRWSQATTVEQVRAALDPPARRVLAGVGGIEDLWRAEAAGRHHLAEAGVRLLRDPLAGPQRVVGAIAVLAADAFRVRAALAAATVGGGEVLGEEVLGGLV
jgi:hypothetical protein